MKSALSSPCGAAAKRFGSRLVRSLPLSQGAARYHEELAKVRKEKEALLKHFTFFIDPDTVLHSRGRRAADTAVRTDSPHEHFLTKSCFRALAEWQDVLQCRLWMPDGCRSCRPSPTELCRRRALGFSPTFPSRSASRARVEMLPAGAKDRTDIAAAGSKPQASKGSGKPAASSVLATLSRIGGGWRKRGGAEDVAAGRDEDKWLPYLGLEKELTDLKVRARRTNSLACMISR